MKYPGLAYVGSERISALYGLNETIHDQKAIGLQHLFMDDYTLDLIHTGLSVVVCEDTAYYGDRIKPKAGHPLRHASETSSVEHHCVFRDDFKYPYFTKTDRVGSYNSRIVFETTIQNTSSKTHAFQCSGLLITQPELNTEVLPHKDAFIINSESKWYALIGVDTQEQHLSLDAPSGFMYHGIEDLLFDTNPANQPIKSKHPIAMSLSNSIELKPNEHHTFRWCLQVGQSKEELEEIIDTWMDSDYFNEVQHYWREWLGEKAVHRESSTMLVALKSALLRGFLPADLSGHYFAKGKVCFYVRDALMASRAFLYSGHPNECKRIVDELMLCPRKGNGEFYQRYNADLLPDEGANNNVFSQIDVIGYFGRVIADYHTIVGDWLVSYNIFKTIINTLKVIEKRNQLYGPEGGVNEGVYGPAFITSTNMFIVGGLLGAIDYAEDVQDHIDSSLWSEWVKSTIDGIEATFLKEGYYSYGHVDYQPDLIRRYDTPQLLSPSLGYPINQHTYNNLETLSTIATYFKYGYGYSEQEYHNGPWLFNTAGAAETAYLLNDMKRYNAIKTWILDHRNHYGLLPEAVDATNENRSFINPLMWANAEFVCVDYMEELGKLRK